jgi:carboxyl-terminal processing protease
MPRFNFYVILFALFVYALTAEVTLRDRLLIATLHKIEREALFEPSAKDLFEGAMFGLTDALSEEYGDDYTMYIPPGKQTVYRDNLDNRYDGLGISTNIYEIGDEKKLLIFYPFYGSPAYRAGLRSGDQILQIDGEPVADKNMGEILKLLKQKDQPETHLSILPFGQTEQNDISVRRERFHFDSIEGDYYESDKQIFSLEAHPKIGYIRISTFSGPTAKEFDTALDRMMQSGVESFILDMRDNGGGDVWECIQIAQMLLSPRAERNIIVTMQPRSGRERKATITEGSQRCTLPMVVLIDGETASASEIVAAALQDHRRATVVGTRSFGKGVIQGIIELPFQSGMLQLTDAEYRRPSGAAIHRKANAADSDDWGIVPDKIVELSEEEQSAVLQYRSLRSNVVATERVAVLDQFRQQIVVRQNEEEKDSERKPFNFTGAAPYYDAQLDEAIRILMGEK